MDNLKKVSKKTWIIIVAVIIVFGGIWYFASHKKVSVLNKEDVNMSFDGYDSEGSYYYNTSGIEKKIVQTLIDKTKLSDYWESKIKNNFESLNDLEDLQDPEYLDGMEALLGQKLKPSERKHLLRLGQWAKDVDFEAEDNAKMSGLSNGDKVTVEVTIEPNGDKDSSDSAEDHEVKSNPIKPQKITFTAKGLKKIKTASTKGTLSKIDASFSGFDGRGQINIKTKLNNLSDSDVKVKKNGQLSNGDKVTVKFAKDIFEKKGYSFHGSREKTFKVSGLAKLDQVVSAASVQKVTDKELYDFLNYDEDNLKIDMELKGIYVLPIDEYSTHDDYSEKQYQSGQKEVLVNEDPEENSQTFSVVAVYHASQKDIPTGDTETANWTVAIDGLEYQGKQIKVNGNNTPHLIDFDSMTLQEKLDNLQTIGSKIK